jgi:DNA-binding CsgD family transcriptional regulator
MEQRIHRLFFLFGLATLVNNLVLLWMRAEPDTGIWIVYLGIPSLITFIVFLMRTIKPNILRIAHVLILLVIAMISIMEGESHYMGMVFWIIAYYLMQKYGFFVRHTIFRIILAGTVLLAAFTISYVLGGGDENITAIPILFFFYFGVFYYGDQETFIRYQEQAQSLQKRIENLEEVSGAQSILDLKALGFSDREIEVGQILVTSLGTDKELAYDLGISASTVAKHLSSMREKAHAPSRQHLIDAIRGYYLLHQRENTQRTIHAVG